MDRSEKVSYFVARAKVAETNKFAKAGQWVLFTWSDEGGGWPQLVNVTTPEPPIGGKRFNQPPTQTELSWWQGMPLNIRFDPNTVEIVKVTEVHETSVESLGAPAMGEGNFNPQAQRPT